MTPDLDRWSAEKVMGWKHFQFGDELFYIPKAHDAPKPDDLFIPTENGWHPSNPTTGQIWVVVEKMRELGWKMILHAYDNFYSAKFGQEHSWDSAAIFHSDPNPCLAILQAAWQAMEGQS